MKHMIKPLFKNAAEWLLIIGVFVLWTNYVWDSAFDQGSAISLCVVESFRKYDGQKVATETLVCKDAKAYESNPLWQLRRKG